MAHIRDRPSLRESLVITAPSGKTYRWSDDEFQATNRPSGERWSDTIPGGYETLDATLPRKSDVDYSDLEGLSTLTRYDAAGEIIWQGRLERAPRVSGDEVAISPSAVGWQAHLEDDKGARMIYRDISLERWGPVSNARRVAASASNRITDHAVVADATEPQINTSVDSPWGSPFPPRCEAWYDAGPGVHLQYIFHQWTRGVNTSNADANWTWQCALSSDDIFTAFDTSGNLRAAGPGTGFVTATGSRRYAVVQLVYAAVAAASNANFDLFWKPIVYGNHGLSTYGVDPDGGFRDGDIIGHALSSWCPRISYSTESITSAGFRIPHLVFADPTTAGEIIRQATRFGLRDWAVWDGPTFWLYDRGARGRSWRARVGPAQLEETGPQVDRLWNNIIVAYQDVDGSTRTVGPVGSGADTESAVLTDDDPENPANRAGVTRQDLLTMGTSTAAGATEIGRRFLEESRVLDASGRAAFVGHVEDDRGVMHPYSHVHAGDTVRFVDAGDTSLRRIVRTDKDRATRTCSIDIDAPPEGLQALLERLGVVLTPLGL